MLTAFCGFIVMWVFVLVILFKAFSTAAWIGLLGAIGGLVIWVKIIR